MERKSARKTIDPSGEPNDRLIIRPPLEYRLVILGFYGFGSIWMTCISSFMIVRAVIMVTELPTDHWSSYLRGSLVILFILLMVAVLLLFIWVLIHMLFVAFRYRLVLTPDAIEEIHFKRKRIAYDQIEECDWERKIKACDGTVIETFAMTVWPTPLFHDDQLVSLIRRWRRKIPREKQKNWPSFWGSNWHAFDTPSSDPAVEKWIREMGFAIHLLRWAILLMILISMMAITQINEYSTLGQGRPLTEVLIVFIFISLPVILVRPDWFLRKPGAFRWRHHSFVQRGIRRLPHRCWLWTFAVSLVTSPILFLLLLIPIHHPEQFDVRTIVISLVTVLPITFLVLFRLAFPPEANEAGKRRFISRREYEKENRRVAMLAHEHFFQETMEPEEHRT